MFRPSQLKSKVLHGIEISRKTEIRHTVLTRRLVFSWLLKGMTIKCIHCFTLRN